ncbi:NAD-dependent epimerase/dehydratase family protein [Arthrobacter sp. JZ12]|uniref:NAD-dependent epimerase/dehydratase family protein n=1 Tax=Arthrobacter sp. JZ12 TaxID=2654190 RepID=UPI002B478143|nr:NAD-dependent epimerase/dehydratase family protein [Arthrobacter sp. JZ12]WRH25257.1 NAD-dependent epimerase/dehydratase family protein [Arthrobacter sp. JZ12]
MKWAVVGGSGFVGSAVLKALSNAGEETLSLSAPRLQCDAASPADVHDAADRLSAVVHQLAEQLSGAAVVVNAAGAAAPGSTDTAVLGGANALLPVLLMRAGKAAGVRRLIHLSSAAVQGHRPVLDETPDVAPFSPYSRSKALGEQSLAFNTSADDTPEGLDVVIVRATSVQGPDRPTTAALARLAASPLASVAAPGTAPSPVASVDALAELVRILGSREGAVGNGSVPAIVLQPWERLTVRSVLESAGGTPLLLPSVLCRLVLRCAYAVSSLLGERLHGAVRRVELMWFGQDQVAGWTDREGIVLPCRISPILEAAGARRRRRS